MQEFKPIGTGHNRKAQPFVAAANIDDKRQVVSTAYNTPIGLYSSGNIQDAMQGQMKGLVLDKPEGSVTFFLCYYTHTNRYAYSHIVTQSLTHPPVIFIGGLFPVNQVDLIRLPDTWGCVSPQPAGMIFPMRFSRTCF